MISYNITNNAVLDNNALAMMVRNKDDKMERIDSEYSKVPSAQGSEESAVSATDERNTAVRVTNKIPQILIHE